MRGVSDFYNIIVNIIQLCAFVGLNCSKLIVVHGIEIMKKIFCSPINITALAKARKFGL
jgi:hypothetical protein